MATPVKVVYEQGHLRPLHPLDLQEGQEIEVYILTEREQAIAALGDLVTPVPEVSGGDIDEEALLKELDETYNGNISASEVIIQERREGP